MSNVCTGWTNLFGARFPAIEKKVRENGPTDIVVRCQSGDEKVTVVKDQLHVVRDGVEIVGIAIDVNSPQPTRYCWMKNGPVLFPPCSPRFTVVRFTEMQITL